MARSDSDESFDVLTGLSESDFEGVAFEECEEKLSAATAGPAVVRADTMAESHAFSPVCAQGPNANGNRSDASPIPQNYPEGAGAALFSPLLRPENAQRTRVARIKGFFSPSDISEVQQLAQQIKMDVGMVCRDETGSHTNYGNWETLYLNTGGLFTKQASRLLQKMIQSAQLVDSSEGWGLLKGKHIGSNLNVRVVEFHEYFQKGTLPFKKHNDTGSLITMDIMLSKNGEFEGGEFQTLEADGSMKVYEFLQGDALVFVSHKYHCVQPVANGRRNVLIIEIWDGPERHCAHRCLSNTGDCHYNVQQSYRERMACWKRHALG